jgi:putative transposase
MSPVIKKSHNASELVYHLVCPIKYRRKIFTSDNEPTLKQIALEIEGRHELHFLEIGIDRNHVHFLIQTIPTIAPATLANTVKGNLSIQFFRKHPEVKQYLWGGNLWTAGYFINTVGNASMSILKNYIQNQGYTEYKQLHRTTLTLFN